MNARQKRRRKEGGLPSQASEVDNSNGVVEQESFGDKRIKSLEFVEVSRETMFEIVECPVIQSRHLVLAPQPYRGRNNMERRALDVVKTSDVLL